MTLQTLETLVKHWVTFVKGHEKMVLIIGVLLASYFVAQKAITAWDNHDSRQAQQAQAKVDADAVTNKSLADQLAALQAQVAVAKATADAAIAQKHQQTVQQQKVDATLPLPDLAERWTYLLQLEPNELTATTDNKIVVSTDASRTTVNELETIPDLKNQVLQLTSNYNGCDAVRSKQSDTIAGLSVELSDTKAARAEDAKVAKDNEHKAWRKGFKWGAIAGFIGGVVTLHKL